MGCDIHFHVEYFKDGLWHSADVWEFENAHDEWMPSVVYHHLFYVGRDYDLFGRLAGVRNNMIGAISQPRGLPKDVSYMVKLASDRWGSDAHSRSWLSLRELLKQNWTEFPQFAMTVERMRSLGPSMGIFSTVSSDIRCVFWFDN